MTPEFTHCALHVRDLDESIAFYQSYCGLGIVKEHGQGNARTVWMAQGDDDRFVLVLLGGGPDRSQGKDDMTHYGFAVPSRADVDAIAERGRREGGYFGNRRSSRHRPAIFARSKTRAATSSSSLSGSPSGRTAKPHREGCGVLALEHEGPKRVNPRGRG